MEAGAGLTPHEGLTILRTHNPHCAHPVEPAMSTLTLAPFPRRTIPTPRVQYMRRSTVTINYGDNLPLAQGITFA